MLFLGKHIMSHVVNDINNEEALKRNNIILLILMSNELRYCIYIFNVFFYNIHKLHNG